MYLIQTHKPEWARMKAEWAWPVAGTSTTKHKRRPNEVAGTSRNSTQPSGYERAGTNKWRKGRCLFRPYYWYVNDWIYRFKVMALSYPSVADWIFCFFTCITPCRSHLFDNRWLHSLAYFGPHSWHVSGRFYWFKLMTFTCPSVGRLLFAFSNFWPPTALITCSGWWDLWPFFRCYLLYVTSYLTSSNRS